MKRKDFIEQISNFQSKSENESKKLTALQFLKMELKFPLGLRELKDIIDTMIRNKATEKQFETIKNKLKNMRKDALVNGDEFSFSNLVFKALRNDGILDRMNRYIKNLRDKSLSLE